jgi:hypothetical protein
MKLLKTIIRLKEELNLLYIEEELLEELLEEKQMNMSIKQQELEYKISTLEDAELEKLRRLENGTMD